MRGGLLVGFSGLPVRHSLYAGSSPKRTARNIQRALCAFARDIGTSDLVSRRGRRVTQRKRRRGGGFLRVLGTVSAGLESWEEPLGRNFSALCALAGGRFSAFHRRHRNR